MNFDPLSYVISRMDHLQSQVGHLEATNQKRDEKMETQDKRIDSLELWRASLMRTLRKWPFVVAPMGLIVLNIAPADTIKAVIAILAAL